MTVLEDFISAGDDWVFGCLTAQYTHMEFTLNIAVTRTVLCTFVQSDAHWFGTKWCPFVQSEVYSQSDAHWYLLEKHLLSGVSTENKWVFFESHPENEVVRKVNEIYNVSNEVSR